MVMDTIPEVYLFDFDDAEFIVPTRQNCLLYAWVRIDGNIDSTFSFVCNHPQKYFAMGAASLSQSLKGLRAIILVGLL